MLPQGCGRVIFFARREPDRFWIERGQRAVMSVKVPILDQDKYTQYLREVKG